MLNPWPMEMGLLRRPGLSGVGGFQHVPFVDGIGSQPLPPEAGLPGRQVFTWQIGAQASLALFDGAANYGRIRRTFRELDQLQTQRAAIALDLEARVRSARVASVRSLIVSTQMRSAPAFARTATCSTKASFTASGEVSP